MPNILTKKEIETLATDLRDYETKRHKYLKSAHETRDADARAQHETRQTHTPLRPPLGRDG